jgi:hypothetical protein
MTQSPERPPEMSPVVEWFSRHGVKAVGALLLIELAFHAYAISSTKRQAAAPSTASPTMVMDSIGRP